MTWVTDIWDESKKAVIEVQSRTRYTQAAGSSPAVSGYDKRTRTRTVTVQKKGPYVSGDADTQVAANTSDNTNPTTGVGTVKTAEKHRANAAGMYYVHITTDVRGAWSSWSEVS